jgi:hypothetical protein
MATRTPLVLVVCMAHQDGAALRQVGRCRGVVRMAAGEMSCGRLVSGTGLKIILAPLARLNSSLSVIDICYYLESVNFELTKMGKP